MMKSYTAWCTSYEGEKMNMTRECESKKEFAQLLHDNGYKVSFIALTENYEEECEKYHARLERKRRESAIRRECERQWRERDKKFAEELEKRLAAEEEATEEPAQEAETMRFKKDYFAVNTKKIDKYNAIRFDSDIEFYVTNCTEAQEPDAIRKAVEKFVDELKKHGGAEILVESLEMSLRFDEFGPECTFNEIRNGGNAYEIEINRYDDKSMSIYLRICEHQDAPTEEEPAEVQAEEPAAEKPAENPTDSAFIAEMVEALEYFKRVLWNYTDGTRYERDISGDFWGAHECSIILSFVNDRLKAQGAEPYYKLKNDFDSLTECFEEIKQKFEYGDERTIEEIISEYNFS